MRSRVILVVDGRPAHYEQVRGWLITSEIPLDEYDAKSSAGIAALEKARRDGAFEDRRNFGQLVVILDVRGDGVFYDFAYANPGRMMVKELAPIARKRLRESKQEVTIVNAKDRLGKDLAMLLSEFLEGEGVPYRIISYFSRESEEIRKEAVSRFSGKNVAGDHPLVVVPRDKKSGREILYFARPSISELANILT